jgi:hypothetical protein
MSDIVNTTKPAKHPVIEMFDGLSAHLRFLSELGCTGMDCSETTIEAIRDWGV